MGKVGGPNVYECVYVCKRVCVDVIVGMCNFVSV